MAEWVTMRHDETGGQTRFPADDDVIAVQQALGWSVVEDHEPEAPFVPAKIDQDDPDAGAWIEMTHPDLPAATQRVPNDPDAITGAQRAGWQLPVSAATDPETPAPPAPATADVPADGDDDTKE